MAAGVFGRAAAIVAAADKDCAAGLVAADSEMARTPVREPTMMIKQPLAWQRLTCEEGPSVWWPAFTGERPPSRRPLNDGAAAVVAADAETARTPVRRPTLMIKRPPVWRPWSRKERPPGWRPMSRSGRTASRLPPTRAMRPPVRRPAMF